MSIDITSLDDLDPTEVAAQKEILRTMLEEEHPELDYTDGTVNEQLILQPNAEITALNQTNTDRLRRSNSPYAISQDPTLADDDIVDAALSNFLTTRRVGTAVTGAVNIVLSAATPMTVTPAATFTIDGRTFNPDATYTVYTTSTLVTTDTDRLIRVRGDGNYWFAINVVEATVGGIAISQGAEFAATGLTGTVVEVLAAEDFAAGVAEETNAEFLARLDEGTAIQALAGRTSVTAYLKEEYPTITDIRIIGFGDTESIRDARNVLGLNTGGKGDIYARNGAMPQRLRVTVLGSYTGVQSLETAYSITGFFRNYQLAMGVDDVAGFYRAARATYFNPANSESTISFDYEFIKAAIITGFTEDALRGARIVNEPWSPVIGDPIEATYTRYQGDTNVNIVKDLPTSDYLTAFDELLTGYSDSELVPVVYGSGSIMNLTVGQLKDLITTSNDTLRVYDVYVDLMAGLDTVQDFLNDRDTRPAGTDYLLKAPMPCFVSAAVNVTYSSASEVPDTDAITTAAVNAVNGWLFEAGALTALSITAAVQAILPSTAQVSLPLSMAGLLRLPDGTELNLASATALTIPDNSAQGATQRTTLYYLRSEDVTVTLTAV